MTGPAVSGVERPRRLYSTAFAPSATMSGSPTPKGYPAVPDAHASPSSAKARDHAAVR
jgi:hypothetical protein